MNEYRKVLSSREISKRIADCVERMYPAHCQRASRAQLVRKFNDILQGRSDRTPEDLLSELEQKLDPSSRDDLAEIRKQIQDFQLQKEVMYLAYTRRSDQTLPLETQDFGDRSLKIIRQEHYDSLARVGFPRDFFRQAYFDHVTFYCLPDGADFGGSTLQDCEFSVCGMRAVSFTDARLYGTDFHSSLLYAANFRGASLANCRFDDCYLAVAVFQNSSLKSCSVLDSTMLGICFTDARLDGCRFDRVQAENIRDLNTAKITQGGATDEECRANRAAIFRELGVQDEQGGQGNGV